MKTIFSIALFGSLSLFSLSCGGDDGMVKELKKTREEAAKRAQDQADQQLIKEQEAEEKEKEAEAKEAAEKAVAAPPRRGEFSIIITPDTQIKNAFAVPVHVFSVSAAGAKSWQSKSSDDYWKSPTPDAKVIFGTKSGSSQSPFVTKGPFRTGDRHIVIVAKIPGLNRPEVIELERQPGATIKHPPVAQPINVRITAKGIQIL